MTGEKTGELSRERGRSLRGYLAVKRIFDVLAAYVLLMLLYPAMLLLAVALKLSSRGSVIFKQERFPQTGLRIRE